MMSIDRVLGLGCMTRDTDCVVEKSWCDVY